MKNIENKMIAIDKEKENIFFFEFIPSISKAFVEFSTDEDLFEQFKSYPINQIPEQTRKWSEVEEEELPFIHTTCNKYLDEYVKTTAYTHLQDSMIMSFAVLWDASKNITVNFQVIPHFFNIFIILFHLFQKKN